MFGSQNNEDIPSEERNEGDDLQQNLRDLNPNWKYNDSCLITLAKKDKEIAALRKQLQDHQQLSIEVVSKYQTERFRTEKFWQLKFKTLQENLMKNLDQAFESRRQDEKLSEQLRVNEIIRKDIHDVLEDNQFLKDREQDLLKELQQVKEENWLQGRKIQELEDENKTVNKLTQTQEKKILQLEDEKKAVKKLNQTQERKILGLEDETRLLEDICLKLKKKSRAFGRMQRREIELEKMKQKMQNSEAGFFSRVFQGTSSGSNSDFHPASFSFTASSRELNQSSIHHLPQVKVAMGKNDKVTVLYLPTCVGGWKMESNTE
ncbi:tropomyosin-2-like [Clinocottus analis]|uniref:tropomyosin-2-like n=1 Tax=Clinocottus analis TaxID=304258 RepID=UPI0035C25D72